MSRLRHALLLSLVAVAACHPTRGCVEASFELASDSRLPVWFQVPAGLDRKDVAVHLDYMIGPAGRTATVTLRRVTGGKIASVVATLRGDHPLNVPPIPESAPTQYPNFEVLTVGDRSEVLEHRQPEARFYLTDEPGIKKALGVP